jgi:MoxR-like ATPase
MTFIQWKDDLRVDLDVHGSVADQVHVFEERQVLAVNAALAAGRPLLVRGEPGVGKSQLARAAARELGRSYLQHVVDSQTEARDLLWQIDALARLGEAQIAGATPREAVDSLRDRLDVTRFLRPGPLWWAFDWEDAKNQAKFSETPPPPGFDESAATNGFVLLIDEIDKAETDVPNGLLEALGAGEMTPPGRREAPVIVKEPFPLVLITTNEERALPDAFLRRCIVLKMALPKEEDELKKLLVSRGRAHFPDADEDVLKKAADLLATDRREAQQADLRPLPGQAEYLDLLRAVIKQYPNNADRQTNELNKLGEFALRKHAG